MSQIEKQEMMWKCDTDDVKEVTSPVADSLATILNHQRQMLDQVEAKASGPERWQQARKAGCPCAVAKGVRYHTLKPDQIVIPKSEFSILNGQLRISALKATIPVPDAVSVKRVIFKREGSNWYGVLQVVDAKPSAEEPLFAKGAAA